MNNAEILFNHSGLSDEALIDELDHLQALSANQDAACGSVHEPRQQKQPEMSERSSEDVVVSEMAKTDDGNHATVNPNQERSDIQTVQDDPTDLTEKRQFMIRLIAIVVGVLGVIMLISGTVLHRLDEESRRTPEKAQMPEEYIEEFFSGDDFKPDIEKYIEPEAKE